MLEKSFEVIGKQLSPVLRFNDEFSTQGSFNVSCFIFDDFLYAQEQGL